MMFFPVIIIYLNENNFCRRLRARQNHLNELMYGPRPHFLISTVQHLYTMPFKCAFLLIIKLTLHAAETAVEFLALLRRGLERRPPRGINSLSCNLFSILCRISAWLLLDFSCSCRSFSFSAARLRLVWMSSSNSTRQSSAESGRIMPFASAIVNFKEKSLSRSKH